MMHRQTKIKLTEICRLEARRLNEFIELIPTSVN